MKYNEELSEVNELPGAGSQGTILGMVLYNINSNDNADFVENDMKYKFVDDLTILELVLFSSLLQEFDYLSNVPSDIGMDEAWVPNTSLQTQSHLNNISKWTKENKMKLNEKKTSYMVFSWSTQEIATRFQLNNKTLERVEEQKLLGVWISTFLDWKRNTDEICKKAYSRLHLLTKLKYIGTKTPDLIHIYVMYIRCLLEYCSTVWHSSLTIEQITDIERVQKVCLRVILGEENYVDYNQALKVTCLQKRREDKCLKFGL